MGGGGPVGVAWYLGLATGLADQGCDLRRAEIIVGTSAGAVAGAYLLSSMEHLDAHQQVAAWADEPIELDGLDTLLEIYTILAELHRAVGPAQLQHFARLAATAPRARDPEDYVAHWQQRLTPLSWAPDLHVAAIDTATGHPWLFTARSGIALGRAIAASAAAPGVVRPIPIGQRTFIDAGVRSGTNADLLPDLQGPCRVFILAAADRRLPLAGPFLRRCLDRETAHLRAAGYTVTVITPDESDHQAMTSNLLDVTRIPHALAAGQRRAATIELSG